MTEKLGWLDTNVFVHALYANDPHRARCLDILEALESGQASGWIDPTVIHELSYVLIRMPGFPDRQAVHEYIQSFLRLDAVLADDKQALVETLALWASTNLGFVDARLRVLAVRRRLPVCSVNRGDFSDIDNSFFGPDE